MSFLASATDRTPRSSAAMATTWFGAAIAATREFFTLRRAERTVRSYTHAQHARVAACVLAAERRLRAGRRMAEPRSAALMLREAVRAYLLALEAAGGAPAELPPMPLDPARPRATPTDEALARAALAADNPLFFDELPQADAERTRWALDRAASMLGGRVESRSLAYLLGARWGRTLAVILLVVLAAWLGVRAKFVAPDIALGKPVHASSIRHKKPAGLVDGEIGTSFGFESGVEDNPNVVIDLQATYRIDHVDVYNRVDGWFNDCLPLVVELSLDGKDYHEIGRRETYFGADPPWAVAGHGQPARYVRVRVARHSYLTLSEIRVFGTKQ